MDIFLGVILFFIALIILINLLSGGDKKEVTEKEKVNDAPKKEEEVLSVEFFTDNNKVDYFGKEYTDSYDEIYVAEISNDYIGESKTLKDELLFGLECDIEAQFGRWFYLETKEKEQEKEKKPQQTIEVKDGKATVTTTFSKKEVEELMSIPVDNPNIQYKRRTPEEWKAYYQTFTAIDCETANPQQFICQIGLVIMEAGKIVKEIERLVQPPNNEYHPMFSRIHGITPEHTKNAPSFAEVWEDIKEYFNNTTVVAHNGNGADFVYLQKELRRNNLSNPVECVNVDTMKYYGQRKLKDLCLYYNIELNNHHNALDDARACALLYKKRFDVEDLTDFKAPTVEEMKIVSAKAKKLKEQELEEARTNADPNNFFFEKGVLYTGFLGPEREFVEEFLITNGAIIKKVVSSKVDIFIKGDEPGPSKMEKLKEYQDKGCDILILDKEEFYKKIEV